MEKLAGTLADLLVRKHIVDSEDRDFYSYSIIGVMLYALNYITIFVISVCLGMIWEAVFFMVIFQLLRTSCGGKHLGTWWSCYICSSIIITLILLSSQYIKFSVWVYIAVMITSIVCIWFYAPVEHVNHPVEEDILKLNKLRSRIFSCIIGVLGLVLGYLGKEHFSILCISTLVFCSVLLIWEKGEEYLHIRNLKKEGR